MTSLEFNKNQTLLKDSRLFMNGLANHLKSLVGLDVAIDNPQMGGLPLKKIVNEFFQNSLVVSITDSNGKQGFLAANKEALMALNEKGDENAVRMLFHTALLNTANNATPIGGIVKIGDEEESLAYWTSQAADESIKLLVVAYEVTAGGEGQILVAFPYDQYLESENPYGSGYENMSVAQDSKVSVRPAQLPDLDDGIASMQGRSMNYIDDIPMQIMVEVGRSRMSVREVLGINKGSVISLDRMADDPVDILVNGKLFARGEIVVIDEFFGVRIVEIIQNAAVKAVSGGLY